MVSVLWEIHYRRTCTSPKAQVGHGLMLEFLASTSAALVLVPCCACGRFSVRSLTAKEP